MGSTTSRKVGRHIPPRGTSDFLYLALRGAVPGVTRVVVSGFNSDVDVATTPEDIWGGDGLIPRPSAAESWELVGQSANDTSAGTGARTISITTLNDNYDATTQTVTTNGLTAVALTGTHRFVNAATVLTAGSLGKPDAALILRVAGGGAARAYISTESVLNQAKYTVPDRFTLDLHSLLVGVRSGAVTSESVVFNVVLTNEAGRALAPLRLPMFSAGINLYRHEVAGALVPFTRATSRTEVSIRSLVTTANNTQLDAALLALQYDNSRWG